MNMAVQSAPLTDDDKVEQEIQRKGLTAARVTPQRILDVIVSDHYFTAAQGVEGAAVGAAVLGTMICDGKAPRTPKSLSLLTFCVLVLKNGFTVTGESACASPENFDEALGRHIAYKNALEKVWALEGYLLKQRLSEAAASV